MDHISDCMLASEKPTNIIADIKILYHFQQKTETHPSLILTTFNGEIDIIRSLESILGAEKLLAGWKLYCWNPHVSAYLYIGYLNKNNEYHIPVTWLDLKSTNPELLLKIREYKESEKVNSVPEAKDKEDQRVIINKEKKSNLTNNRASKQLKSLQETTRKPKFPIVKENKQAQSEFMKDYRNLLIAPSKRSKERTIREVISLLLKWRELNAKSIAKESGKKLTLNEAAAQLEIPVKSLWDYTLLYQHAKRYGFKFKENMNAGFGKVRKYVKSCKTKGRLNKKTNVKIEEEDDDEFVSYGLVISL